MQLATSILTSMLLDHRDRATPPLLRHVSYTDRSGAAVGSHIDRAYRSVFAQAIRQFSVHVALAALTTRNGRWSYAGDKPAGIKARFAHPPLAAPSQGGEWFGSASETAFLQLTT